jgi:xylulokinase
VSQRLAGEFVASFDIGSSAVKCVLVTRDGQMQKAHTVSYRLAATHGEQDVEDWWLAFREALQNWWSQGVAPSSIAAITFSGQMQCLVALDVQGAVLRKALLHTDARVRVEAAHITETIGTDEIHRVTRNPFNATSVLPKLLHLRDHEPQTWVRTERVLMGAKDCITQRLTDRAVCDLTTAATTGMFDIEQGTWAHSWLAALGLKPVLPELLNAHERVGVVTARAAALTGLQSGCAVLCGLGDAAATTLGAGVSDPSQCYAYLGTSGWVARVSERFNPPGAPLFVLPYLPALQAEPARRILIGPISNAGAVHRWALSLLDSGDLTELQRYAQFEQAVAAAPFDANLMFLPYLSSERLPVNGAAGQGALVGLSMHTTRAQMMRAALEGVSLSLRWAFDLLCPDALNAQGAASGELIVVGGATRSAQWMQILANTFDAPLRIAADADLLPCLGAAATAANALGWCESPEVFVKQRQKGAAHAVEYSVLPVAPATLDMQAKSVRWRALQAAVSTGMTRPDAASQ